MARHGLLLNLENLPDDPPEDPTGNPSGTHPPPAIHTLSNRGPIGAISRSVEQIKTKGVQDLDPGLIDPSVFSDRMDTTTAPTDLIDSIRAHGQQVPILVRPHPESQGRYQIAYGRRRLSAIKHLGISIRAVVTPLTDEQMIVAQGQENSARQDLSFIERALFAHSLEYAKYPRNLIADALNLDQPALSRYITIATQIPHDIIRAIGPAPEVGRTRWLAFASLITKPESMMQVRTVINRNDFLSRDTNKRFGLALLAATEAQPEATHTTYKRQDGIEYARVSENNKTLTITIRKKIASGFAEHISSVLSDLYDAYTKNLSPSTLDSEAESDQSIA